MAGRVAGKKALITGAAQGLGAEMARLLASEGATLLLTDINGAGVAKVAAEINAKHGAGTAFSAQHDVTDEAAWVAVVAQARADLGGLSVLVNNAGMGTRGMVEEIELSEWRKVFAVNMDGTFLGCKHALPLLKEAPAASIINISSIAAMIVGPGMSAYHAAKAAVWTFSKAVAIECARKTKVRCNSIHPAWTDTAILDGLARPGASHEEVVDKLGSVNPMRRVGQPHEIAAAVLFLASDESSYMTGAELKLDGGLSAT